MQIAKKICFLLDIDNNWLSGHCKNYKNKHKNKDIKIHNNFKKVKNYDYVFVLGYTKILPKIFIERNKLAMVVHESNLPIGKGFSPLQWQILKKKNTIKINLIKLESKVDSGDIILTDNLKLNGSELYDEIRKKQADVTFKLIDKFLSQKINCYKKQKGKETFFRKRSPVDSKIDIKQSLKKNFNLMRICNNEKWPAFFYYKNQKYILKIFKD
jgi:methionyl-tRNA formyltransferase